ncbi:ras protein [Paraphysoderma sedebokerense]|nr:ras protein [Paraphysoderma sedebokerense]
MCLTTRETHRQIEAWRNSSRACQEINFPLLLWGVVVPENAITLQFMRNQFVEEYDPTIEDSYIKSWVVDRKDCTLEITDTAGQEEYRIISRDSFLELRSFKEQIFNAKEENKIPIIVIGNKCDLKDLREVSDFEGRQFASSFGAEFLETSAKLGVNIERAFATLVRLMRKLAEPEEPEFPISPNVPAKDNRYSYIDADERRCKCVVM